VFIASLEPARTEQEARAQQIRLRAAASVLGVETVALTEVLKNFKGNSYIGGMPRFIEALFANLGQRTPEAAPRLGKPVEGERVGSLPRDVPGDAKSSEGTKHRCPKCGGALKVLGDGLVECPICGASFRTSKRKATPD